MTAEEYLEVEKSAKKAKSASDKLKIGGSGMPSIEEVAASLVIPDQPAIPKKRRIPAVRKIRESPYVVKEAEDVEAAPDLASMDLKGKKAEAEKVLEIASEL
jgi:hypothetical protein